MLEFVLTGLLASLLIATSSFVIYETLRYCWRILPTLKGHPRMRALSLVLALFAGHIVNIWIFGIVYFLLEITKLGTLTGTDIVSGQYRLDVFGYIYFSAVSYTTLGIGDIMPEGGARMIAGAESLVGFMMIGWTVTFSYLAMEKFWALPHRRN